MHSMYPSVSAISWPVVTAWTPTRARRGAVQPSACGGGLAHCCGVDCSGYGGERLCPGSGGLQLRRCTEDRMRSCRPVPLRPLSSRHPYYVSSRPQWTTVPPRPHVPARVLQRPSLSSLT